VHGRTCRNIWNKSAARPTGHSASGVGHKSKRGHWHISFAWAEALERALGNPVPEQSNAQCLLLLRSGEDSSERVSVSEDELRWVTRVFGCLPLYLSHDEKSVLRTVLRFCKKRDQVKSSVALRWIGKMRSGTLRVYPLQRFIRTPST